MYHLLSCNWQEDKFFSHIFKRRSVLLLSQPLLKLENSIFFHLLFLSHLSYKQWEHGGTFSIRPV